MLLRWDEQKNKSGYFTYFAYSNEVKLFTIFERKRKIGVFYEVRDLIKSSIKNATIYEDLTKAKESAEKSFITFLDKAGLRLI